MKKASRQSGNVVLMILIAIALFGALAYTFMRGSQQGQGNLTGNQARIAAQELQTFFTYVDQTANKLRSRGCSVMDLSFSNSGDTGTYVSLNNSATAPVDKSCHVFDAAGGNINFNMDWSRYQLARESITPASEQYQHGNIVFNYNGFSVPNIGTTANDHLIVLDFVQPSICEAYNQILNVDTNSTLGNLSYCVYQTTDKTHGEIIHAWLIN